MICLDVLRAIGNDPGTLDALLTEIELGGGGDRRFDAYCDKLKSQWKSLAADPLQARRLVERLALALQGSLLVRFSPPAVADAFCATRLAGDGGLVFGTLPAGIDFDAIIQRARP